MMTTAGRREFSRRTERIEQLVRRLESAGDPALHAVASELLQAVIEMHAVALDRMFAVLARQPGGDDAIAAMADDDPVDVETRVLGALEKVRPYLHSHGGDVELLSVSAGVVRLRLQGSCGSCSSSSATLKGAVEDAIYQAAPEVAEIVAEPAAEAAHIQQLVVLK